MADLQKWMSDRFNENMLIKLGHLYFNPNQMNQDCFVLEAYLLGQYEGSVRSGQKLEWSDKVFKPNFRLPSKEELQKIQKEFRSEILFREYPYTTKDFLHIWNRNYVSVNRDKRSLTLNLSRPVTIEQHEALPGQENQVTKIKEVAHLGKEFNLYDEISYLKTQEVPEKDQYGRMDFEILGNGDDGFPIVGHGRDRFRQDSADNKMYFMAYSLIIPKRYWP